MRIRWIGMIIFDLIELAIGLTIPEKMNSGSSHLDCSLDEEKKGSRMMVNGTRHLDFDENSLDIVAITSPSGGRKLGGTSKTGDRQNIPRIKLPRECLREKRM